jgi:hypothetical protein
MANEKNSAEKFAAFSEELLKVTLDGLKDDLSPEEYAAMEEEGRSMIEEYKAEKGVK